VLLRSMRWQPMCVKQLKLVKRWQRQHIWE